MVDPIIMKYSKMRAVGSVYTTISFEPTALVPTNEYVGTECLCIDGKQCVDGDRLICLLVKAMQKGFDFGAESTYQLIN